MGANPKPARTSLLALVVVVLLAATWPLHPGPPIYLEVEISEGVVRCKLTGEQATVLPWLGMNAPLPLPMSAETRRAVLKAAGPFLAKEQFLSVDRKRLPAILEDAAVPERHKLGPDMPVIQIVFRFECEGTPRSVKVGWSRFRGPGWHSEEPSLPVRFKCGPYVRYELIYEEEPEFIWHRKPRVRAKKIDVYAVTTKEKADLALPLPSTLLLLAVGLSFLFLRRRRLPWLGVWGARLAAAALAAAVWDTGVVAVPNPWSTRAAIPDRTAAIAMFERLHGNIYRAFDAITEDQIYDLLAISVDRGILDELYGEVYESLVMRREGGAMCKIDRIEVLDRAVQLSPDTESADSDWPEFSVNWKWNVHGSVTHWGHQHKRINSYHAKYRVRHDGQSWKIGGVKILNHQRVDDG